MAWNTRANCAYLLIIFITLGFLIFGLIVALRSTNVIVATPGSSINYFEQSSPSIFLIKSTFDIIYRNSENNDTWIPAITDFLEMAYRHYGITNEYLSKGQAVRFSTKFIENFITNSLVNSQNLTAINFLKLYQNFSTFKLIAYPEYNSTLPFDYDYQLKNNLIEFSLSSSLPLFSVSDIKAYLLEYQEPILISFYIPTETSIRSPFLPSNELYNNFDIDTNSYELINGVIVGWNDNHPSNIGSFNYINSSTGGFILKIQRGNIISKYDGSFLSKENEKICHINNPQSWTPIDLLCLSTNNNNNNHNNNNNNNDNLSECFKSVTILKCSKNNQTYCNSSYEYALAGLSGKSIIDGKFYRMVQWPIGNKSQYQQFLNQEVIAHLISSFYKPKNKNLDTIADPSCAYSFVPYDLLYSTPYFEALYAHLDWTKSSYPRGSDSKKYEFIQKATYDIQSRPNSTIYNSSL